MPTAKETHPASVQKQALWVPAGDNWLNWNILLPQIQMPSAPILHSLELRTIPIFYAAIPSAQVFTMTFISFMEGSAWQDLIP